MAAYKDKGFSERLSTGAEAKRAMLERVRAKPGPDDPAIAERRAAREAIIVAREARMAERKAAREAELAHEAARVAEMARQAAEQAELEAAREAERKRQTAERAVNDVALEAERKAARDARYAARKSRR